ncbi:MAG: archaetidylserine decarboxylase [Myxococcota bacterium]
MNDPAIVTLLSLVPRRLASGLLGRVARTPSRWLARAFARVYDVDLTDAELPLSAYPSLDALFTRRLRPGTRPVDPDPNALVSPVDGTVAWCGPTDGAIPLGPVPFALADVVSGPVAIRAAVVVYLSPRDYHRVHAPVGGRIEGYRYVPGSRWPVFPSAVASIPRLFARNERLVFAASTPRGRVDIVLVGAFGVGRIRSPLITGPLSAGSLEAPIGPGDEIGVFHLGSTVLVGLPDLPAAWEVAPGDRVRMGRALARFDPPR